MKLVLLSFFFIFVGCSTPSIAPEDFYPSYLESERPAPEPLPKTAAKAKYEDLQQRKPFDHFISDMNEEQIMRSVREEGTFPESNDQWHIVR